MILSAEFVNPFLCRLASLLAMCLEVMFCLLDYYLLFIPLNLTIEVVVV